MTLNGPVGIGQGPYRQSEGMPPFKSMPSLDDTTNGFHAGGFTSPDHWTPRGLPLLPKKWMN